MLITKKGGDENTSMGFDDVDMSQREEDVVSSPRSKKPCLERVVSFSSSSSSRPVHTVGAAPSVLSHLPAVECANRPLVQDTQMREAAIGGAGPGDATGCQELLNRRKGFKGIDTWRVSPDHLKDTARLGFLSLV